MVFYNCHTHISKHPESEIYNAGTDFDLTIPHSWGIHPWNEEDYNKAHEMPTLNKHCVAIGEVGLDKLKGGNLSEQIKVFEQQIEWSETLKLPVIIHCVKAWNEIQQIKRSLQPKQKWVYHGLSKHAILPQILDEGLLVSLGSNILNHPHLERFIKDIPDDCLLLETDTSDTSIKWLYEHLAEIKKISLSEFRKSITQNFEQTFQKWQTGLKEQNSL